MTCKYIVNGFSKGRGGSVTPTEWAGSTKRRRVYKICHLKFSRFHSNCQISGILSTYSRMPSSI